MSNKVLFFGPFPEPITGQSISFKEVYDNYSGGKILFDTTVFGSNKYLNTVYCLMVLPLYFLFKRFDKIYFTCSRSKFGFLKDLVLVFLSSLSKKKIINHLHGADFKDFVKNAGKLRALIDWTYNKVDTSIVLLPSMKSQFEDFPNMNIEFVENSFSSDYININVNIENKKKEIVYLSNLMYSKGVFVFLDAIEKILEENNDWNVKLAGSIIGDDYMSKKELELEFKKYRGRLEKQFPDQFFFVGKVYGDEKIKLLSQSSIFVLPTFYKTEAFPISIVEAMKFGNAIITTDHNYLSDIISSSNGYIVPVKSEEKIKCSIDTLISNMDLLSNIQENNIREANSQYSPSIFNKRINKILVNT